jgi:hypothetical protein
MQSRVLAGLVAIAALAGCATPPPPAADPAMRWAFDPSGSDGARLAFGRPQTDDVPVMLTCQPGSGRVRISAAAPSAAASPVLKLSSKAVSSRTTGRIDGADPLGPRLEAEAPVGNPALAAFSATGQLVVEAGGAVIAAPAGDPAPVRSFFAACRP